jgi:hypothetical protein
MSVPSRNNSSSEDISRARCTKRNQDNGGFETQHQGRSGSNFSQHGATSNTELAETLGGMFRQRMPPHRRYIQEVNVVIKMLCVKDNFSNKVA